MCTASRRVKAEIDSLKDLVSTYLKPLNNHLDLVQEGAAFLPRTENGLPMISKVRWDKLMHGTCNECRLPPPERGLLDVSRPSTIRSVFVNGGQFLDGIILTTGSGKIMSEIIKGEKPS